MRENYTTCLKAVLKYEGGYVNHPRDPGGATNKGITQKTYDAWRQKQGLAIKSVRGISQEDVEAIYRRDYWDAVRGDELPGGVDLAVFDFAVNSGVRRASDYLKTLLGTNERGIGPKTVEAARRNPYVWEPLCDRRLAFMKRLDTWSTFGRGWNTRVSDVRKLASVLAKDGARLSSHSADVAFLQKRLTELNYPTGGADGIVGPLTRSAIRDFQDANNLVINGKFDRATAALLESKDAPPRPIPPERAALTAEDLRERGSKIIAAADETKYGAAGAALATAAGVASEAKEVAAQVEDIRTGLESGAGVVEVVRDYWPALVVIVAAVVAVYFLWRAYQGAHKVVEERVANARTGINLRV